MIYIPLMMLLFQSEFCQTVLKRKEPALIKWSNEFDCLIRSNALNDHASSVTFRYLVFMVASWTTKSFSWVPYVPKQLESLMHPHSNHSQRLSDGNEYGKH